jgi:hypothetical protein
MNRWDIPDWLEREVVKRDHCCIYCGVEFTARSPSRRDRPSWEHIINDARTITRENIARCCVGCNASKQGHKESCRMARVNVLQNSRHYPRVSGVGCSVRP